MLDLDSFREKLESLITKFEKDKTHYLSKGYPEAQVRIDFINPFFKALGWDIENKAQKPPHGEAYKRQGYQVEERGGNEPDGGIDLILIKKGEMVLVQCKHWEAEQVGVKIVRELYGVVAAEGATKGIVVTTGYFTRDAEIFAQGKPLLLIRGNELSRLIEEGQKALISKSAKTSTRRP